MRMASISWALGLTDGLQHAVFRRRDGQELVLEYPCGVTAERIVATPENCQLHTPLRTEPFSGWCGWMPVCDSAWCLQSYVDFLQSSPTLRCSPRCADQLADAEERLAAYTFDPMLAARVRASRASLLELERMLLSDVPDLSIVRGVC